MRSAALMLLVALSLGGCATPVGGETELCDGTWRNLQPQIVEPGGADERAVTIDCMRPLERRRLRIGFTMPDGPDCHRLSRIDVVESADAVSVTVFLARDPDPAVGACPADGRRVRTELDLQQPVGNRTLLDGSVGSE